MSELWCLFFHRPDHRWFGTWRVCLRCDRFRPPGIPVRLGDLAYAGGLI